MHFLSRTNRAASNFGDFLKDFLLLILRLYWGWNFLIGGWTKFGNIEMVQDFFGSLNIPFPLFSAYLVAVVELVGGICLILGLFARLASIPLAITMIVALFTAHLSESSQIFENPQRFINQLPFTYLLVSLIILCFGPGRFSIDHFMERSSLR